MIIKTADGIPSFVCLGGLLSIFRREHHGPLQGEERASELIMQDS
jgi:hypothetical protein